MTKCTRGHWYEGSKCPFCHAEDERAARRTPRPYKMTEAERIYNCYPSLIDEYERVKALKVPASFTKEKPDTPEAKAARRQVEISQGIDVPDYRP